MKYKGTLINPKPLQEALSALTGVLENNLRKALILSRGDFSTFFTRRISLLCFVIAVFILLSPLIPSLKKKREKIAVEEVS